MIAGLIVAILTGINAPGTLFAIVVVAFVLGKGIELLGRTRLSPAPFTHGNGRPK